MALLLTAMTAAAVWACNSGKGGSNSVTGADMSMPDSAPTTAAKLTPAAAPKSGICAGKDSYQATFADGTKFTYCVLESTLELADNRCQLVPEGGKTWTHRIGITSSASGYFLDQIFHSNENSCGSTGANGGKGPYNAETFPSGDSDFTFTYTRGDGCGMDQEDIYAVINDHRIWVRAVVFNFPKPCRDCAALKTKLNEKQTGKRSYEVSPTWNGGGTAALNWGDGTPVITGVRSGEIYSHTYTGNGPYTIDLVVTQNGLECPDPVTVKFNPDPEPTPTPPPTCKDYRPPTITGSPQATTTATTVDVSAGSAAPTGGWFSPNVPFSVNRPEYGQSATSWSTRYTLPYGPENLECSVYRYFSGSVPPKEGTCEQRNPEYGTVDASGSKSVTGTSPHMSLTVSSSWSVTAGKAQTLTFEIVYNINSSNFVKKSKSQSFACGEGGQGSLTWGQGDTYNSSPNYSSSDGHITGTFTLRVKRGSTVVGTYPLP